VRQRDPHPPRPPRETAAEIDRELPGLSDSERRRLLEERLRERVAIEAEALA
jgi:hypothetical protein